jgi:glutathione S-transferase
MPARLYSLSLSHPSHAARLMLERKGIENKVVNVPPGFHPLVVRAIGFSGPTVPALRIDGRRVQESRAISRFLDELTPEPPLFPADPQLRLAVEEAERWGDETLQPLPRRIIRWGCVRHQHLRRWISDEAGLPAPGLGGWLSAPIARRMARVVGASDGAVRSDVAALPELLAHADALIEEGTIGRDDEPNAADFQIATTVRALLAFQDLKALVGGHPVGGLARRILPDYPDPIPSFLPRAWL